MKKREVIYCNKIPSDLDGVYYDFGKRSVSLVTSDKIFKTILPGFDNKEQAERALGLWRSKDWTGAPSSPASFFRRQAGNIYTIQFSYNNLFSGFQLGGWVEAFQTGFIEKPLTEYDINRAYFSSILRPLPVPSGIRKYKHGDKRFLVVASYSGDNSVFPRPLRTRRFLFSHEDLNFIPMDYNKLKIIAGVSWEKEDLRILDTFEELSGLDNDIYKRLTQSYWGVFGSSSPLHGRSIKDGKLNKQWKLGNNRFKNSVWANLIQKRVMNILASSIGPGTVRVYMDSILTSDEIPVGSRPGQFKISSHWPKGIWMRNAGMWTDDPTKPHDQWERHAGIASEL